MSRTLLCTALALALSPATSFAQSVLEEIVVTARKTEETLQEAPVSVAVVSARLIDQLDLNGLEDIAKLTAGLSFDNEFSRGADRPVIRGQANILGSSGVSYFIDGVYIEGSIADYDLEDIARMEVVKGPQSALYGRNTYSGAINIITLDPGEEAQFRFKGTVAEHDQFEANATFKGPIIDGVLSGGITARYYEFGGEHENLFDGDELGEEESRSLSGVLVWTPNDRTEIRGRAYYAKREDGQSAIFLSNADQNNCFFDNGSLYGGGGRYFCGVVEPRDADVDLESQITGGNAKQDTRTSQVSLNISYDLNDQWTFRSISGYNKRQNDTVADGDYQRSAFEIANFTPGGFPFTGFPTPPFGYGYVGTVVDFTFSSLTDTEDFGQEIRFEFEGERTRAMIGGYYFSQNISSRDTRVLPPGAQDLADANFTNEFFAELGRCAANPICGFVVPFFGSTITVPRDVNKSQIENVAIFGMFGYDITDTVTLSVEGRYADEEIERDAFIRDLGDFGMPPTTSKASFDSFNPRITVDWQATDNTLLYAVYAEGNKPGGFNSTVAIEAGLPTFDEEEVKSFEIGTKNTLADGQLVLNGSIFFNDIEGYQLTQNARAGANTTSATVNAGDAEIKGLEVEMLYRPAGVNGLTLSANYTHLDPEFTEGFDQNEGVLLDAADDGLINCSTGDQFPDVGGCTSLFGSLDGKQIPRTAENAFFADVDYRQEMNNGWEWHIGANLSYEDSKFSQVHNFAETGDSTLVNLRAGFRNDNYSVLFWGKNVTDEDSVPNVLRYADSARSFRRSFAGLLRRGPQYGVTVTANF